MPNRRRAQAINSGIKSAGLKYITQYIDAESEDRVYIDHTEIGPMYAKKEEYWLQAVVYEKLVFHKFLKDLPDLEEWKLYFTFIVIDKYDTRCQKDFHYSQQRKCIGKV